MVGPETGDRQIERRFAVLGMVDFVLGNLYLTSLNLTKCYKLVNKYPCFTKDLSGLAK